MDHTRPAPPTSGAASGSTPGETSDEELFDGAAQLRVAAVEHLGLRGEDRIAGLVTGAGYPDALDHIADALVGLRHPVLDVGAGLGAASAYLASRSGSRVVALEPEAGAATLAATTFPGLPTIVGEAAALPMAGARCGAITFLGTLSLVPDLDPVLRDAARVLTSGGRLAITDLCLASGASAQTTETNVFRASSVLVEALDRHGFDTDAVTTMSASRTTRWDEITDRVDGAMEARFGKHPAMSAWRDDRKALHGLITSGTLEVAIILARARR